MKHRGVSEAGKNTRPYKAGRQMAEALEEVGNILYLLDNRVQFLRGLADGAGKALFKARHEQGKKDAAGE